MNVTPEEMLAWCQTLLGARKLEGMRTLPDYLAAVPRLAAIRDVPSGTAVLVRGDLDAKPGPKLGEGDVRLRSMEATLRFGQNQGWKQVVFGHIGRKPDQSLGAVAKRLGEIMGCEIPLVQDWLDDQTTTIKDHVREKVKSAQPGSILMLENTRRYDIERVLWDAGPEQLNGLAPKLATLANEFAAKVAQIYVNEAFSAGSLDSSTTVVPAGMQRVALGAYVAKEFDTVLRCLEAQLVVFSGIKIDKLDDLEAIVERGKVRQIITAGSLAMAVKKAEAALAGQEFSLGVAEEPAHQDKPYYIPRERIEQARRLISSARGKGIEIVTPIDFVLADGQLSDTIGAGKQQFDVGPKTSDLFARKVSRFIEEHPGHGVAFYNGVFGMFEDSRFEAGTKTFIPILKRMKDAGIEVYVGGGEGGTALERYGSESDVTHSFTAGGTVLNALGSQPVPYLVALAMAAKREMSTR